VLVLGVNFIQSLSMQVGFSAKMVFNEAGAIFFSSNLQHRDQKAPQISYEDNYTGNALAAMLAPGRIEIRYHRDFADGRVTQIVRSLLAEPALAFMHGWQVTYQGRAILV
jgi:hypothetical protein